MRLWLVFTVAAALQAQTAPDLGSGGVWLPRAVADVAPPQALRHLDAPKPPDPAARCLPPGVPRIMLQPRPFEIVQGANRILFLFEGGAHVWRQVWMDGRAHPKDPNPDWLGDSIGHWKGSILVVDSDGFNDKTWLDDLGHWHSQRLHVTETFTRSSRGTMKYEAIIDDPGAYPRPWTIKSTFAFRPGGRLAEDVCLDKLK